MSPERLQLAEAHRQAQIRVRAQALRDALVFWQTIDPEAFDETWARTLESVRDIVASQYDSSVELAQAYYQANRELAGMSRLDDVPRPVELNVERLTTSLRVTGPVAWRQAIAAGKNPYQAYEVMLVRQAGAAGRMVLEGGRQRVQQIMDFDQQAVKYMRATDGTPCAFCAMLAGRGAIYLSERSGGFAAHDHCACSAVPGFKDDPDLLQRNEGFAQTYNDAIASARAEGTLRRGTSNDLLNAFRRAYAG